MRSTATHPFDVATGLVQLEDGDFVGQTSPAYLNMVGPFGGITAAQLLTGVMAAPDRMGTPVFSTVNFMAPVQAGEFRLRVRITRQNRSSQHWYVEQIQGEKDEVRTNATVMTAIRRDTWHNTEIESPSALKEPPAELSKVDTKMEWVDRFRFHFLKGGLRLLGPEEDLSSSQTHVWVQNNPSRVPDFPNLLALSDSFFPRIYLRRPEWVAIGTVSMTTYFHCSEQDLCAAGELPLFGSARGQVFSRNYFDQTSHIWSQEGKCLATSNQMVYYKG